MTHTIAGRAAATHKIGSREIITLRDAKREPWTVTDHGEGSGASRFIASPVYPLAVKDPGPIAGPSLSNIACALQGVDASSGNAALIAIAEVRALAVEPGSFEEAAAALCRGSRFLIINGLARKIETFSIAGSGAYMGAIYTTGTRENPAMPSGFELCDGPLCRSDFPDTPARVSIGNEAAHLEAARWAMTKEPLKPDEMIGSLAIDPSADPAGALERICKGINAAIEAGKASTAAK